MALKPCMGCKKELDTTATTCPGCGRPDPTGAAASKSAINGLAGILGAGLMIWIGVKTFGGASTDGASSASVTASAEPAAPAAPAGPAIEVTAIQLHRDYEANEVAADAKYKGRTLLVDGAIDSIDKDFSGDVVLHLRSGDQFNHVAATMKTAGGTAELHRRQRITVTCKGGTRIIGSATLDDCVLTSVWR